MKFLCQSLVCPLLVSKVASIWCENSEWGEGGVGWGLQVSSFTYFFFFFLEKDEINEIFALSYL